MTYLLDLRLALLSKLPITSGDSKMSCRWAVAGPGVRVWEATDVIGLVSVSAQFYHMPERHERVLVRWHCAKGKGHAELNIENPRVKTFSDDFPKLHHSKTNSFCANVHLRQSFWKTVKVTKRSCDVTPRSKYQESKGHPWSPCPSIWWNSDYYLQSYGILNKMAHVIFLWSAAILKVSV